MKEFKRILTITMITIFITTILISCNKKVIATSSRITQGQPVKVGVLLNRLNIDYIPLVRQNLEEIQKENQGKVEFTFFYAEENQATQDNTINSLLKEGVDLLLLNIVNIGDTQKVINKIKEYNVPVILFNREPTPIDAIRSYDKAYYIGTDSKEAGMFQGKILVDEWNANKLNIDKNKDNTMQYVMLQGEKENLEAIGRTKYAVSVINDAGIKTDEIALRIANWDKELAKDAMEALFLKYGNDIEAIIANNDGMAEGAIEALQKYGYNKGDKAKTIAVVGIDATPIAQDLIKKGYMTGTVVQDAPAMAKALYTIGMNLAYNKNPLEGTGYKFDDTGVSIRIPYKKYSEANN